ncbi:MAG: 2-amino-4-hydroxy-6-hydroxymethyldihydropteridine diphosphokinase [Pirellulales bacterium]
MATCLLGLGSNVGDSEATLRAALNEIDALPNARLRRRSEWHRCRPLGGPRDQAEFLNAAAVIETTIPPLTLLDELQGIESRHGRQRGERWAPRTLDIDVLLYGNEVAETEMLTLPHPRMSFRRFVLRPAAEVAPRMLHPVIGWPVERLLLHLDAASDQAAVLSPSESLRSEVATLLASRFGAATSARPQFATADQLWPPAVTTWLDISPLSTRNKPASAERAGLPYAAAAFPKLTILLDAEPQSGGTRKSEWSPIVRQPGRGPTLRLQASNQGALPEEVFAAVESVWPDLGPSSAGRLE